MGAARDAVRAGGGVEAAECVVHGRVEDDGLATSRAETITGRFATGQTAQRIFVPRRQRHKLFLIKVIRAQCAILFPYTTLFRSGIVVYTLDQVAQKLLAHK